VWNNPAMSCHLMSILLLLALVVPARAADPLALGTPPAGSEIQLFIENDMLAHTDRYYTNGFKLGVGLPFDLLQAPAAQMLRSLDPDNGDGIQVGLFLGQNLYTPRDITIAAPQPNDRPWAAWLYLGGVAQRARNNRLDTVEFDVGVVGPAALGEPIQKAWHRLIDTKVPRGWDNQGKSEPAFMLSYLQKRRVGSDTADLILHGGGSLGTVMTHARAGATARLGWRLTGYGPDTIEPGGAMLQSTRAQGARDYAGLSWSVFAGVDHRLVAHNIFLDGPVFRDGPSVERRKHVRDVSLGFSVRVDQLRFSWTRVARSSEFRTATGSAAAQRFDSLNLGYEF
jgi:lipid A 3-O-deacylase